jgi:hypothetical protein
MVKSIMEPERSPPSILIINPLSIFFLSHWPPARVERGIYQSMRYRRVHRALMKGFFAICRSSSELISNREVKKYQRFQSRYTTFQELVEKQTGPPTLSIVALHWDIHSLGTQTGPRPSLSSVVLLVDFIRKGGDPHGWSNSGIYRDDHSW